MDQSRLTMSIDEVCKATGIGRSTIYNAIRFGRLRAVKFAGRTLVRVEDLKSFLDALPAISAKEGQNG